MVESRKFKNDERRKILKIKFRGKISLCVVNLEFMRIIINGEFEILGNIEKNLLKLLYKIKLFKTLNFILEINLEYNNLKKILEMSLRNGNKNLMNFVLKGNVVICCKDNFNIDFKKSVEEFFDDILECINSLNMDLMLRLNEFRVEFIDLDVWLINCLQNNVKKFLKMGGKKERDLDIDFGGLKDVKKEGKKKGKREFRKKRNIELSDVEFGDFKDGKKKLKYDKKNEIKKKKDIDFIGSGFGAFMVLKKGKTEKKSIGKKSIGFIGSEFVDLKSINKVKK